ncbi:hypothetical protein P4C99_14885 [Pontiellaceae bacterium B1224]|nr:hypothetical protein [Pontiellaceae bacterium B1224]
MEDSTFLTAFLATAFFLEAFFLAGAFLATAFLAGVILVPGAAAFLPTLIVAVSSAVAFVAAALVVLDFFAEVFFLETAMIVLIYKSTQFTYYSEESR